MAGPALRPRRLSYAAATNLGLAALVGLLVALVGMGYRHLADSISSARLIVGEYLPAQMLLHELDESLRTGLQLFGRYHGRERVTERRVLAPLEEMAVALGAHATGEGTAAERELAEGIEAAKTAFSRAAAAERKGVAGGGEEIWAEFRQDLGKIRRHLREIVRTGGEEFREPASKISRLLRLAESGLRAYRDRDRIGVQDVVEPLERALGQAQDLSHLPIAAGTLPQLIALEEGLRRYRTIALQYADDESRNPSESLAETLQRMWDQADRTARDVREALDTVTPLLVARLETEQKTALTSALGRQRSFGAVAMLGIILAGVISIFLGRTLSSRIRGIVAGSEEIASGNLRYRLPVDAQDSLGRLSVAFNHMAERVQERESELQLLGTALSQADDAVLVMDANGIAQYCNPAFAAVSGDLCREVVGRNFRETDSSNDTARLLRRVLGDAAAHGGTWAERGRITTPGAPPREVDLRISPVRDDAGTVQHLVAVLRDVTQQAGLEVHLRETQKMQAIGTLAGGIAHDFNNLLLPIMAYGSMVLEELAEGSKARRRQTAILRSAEQAQELIAQLQRFSRPEEERFGPMPLGPLVKEVGKLMRSNLPEHIEIETRVDPAVPLVWAEPTQIHQVLLNLLSNAAHAMGKNAGAIRVAVTIPEEPLPGAVSAALQERGAVCLSVTDEGQGMGPEIRQRIFEPFFTTKAPGEGSGLGLSVAQQIIADHGGTITVESTPGQGTAFRVYLPVSDPAEAVGRSIEAEGAPTVALAGKG